MRCGSLAGAVLVVCAVLSGCSAPPSRSSGEAPVRPEPVMASVDMTSGVQVRLLSVSSTRSPSTRGTGSASEPGRDGLWLAFDVVNTSEESVAVSNRPGHPSVTDAKGRELEPSRTSARIDGGGGHWGPAAVAGGPYIDPGGTLHVFFSFNATDPPRPLRITYWPVGGPLGEESVKFVVP